MAPGLSNVNVYVGPDVLTFGGTSSGDYEIFEAMAMDDSAMQLSCSWAWNPADYSALDPMLAELVMQGQNLFAASGDSGSWPVNGHSSYYPQEDIYVTAVGGTALITNGAYGPWASETGWEGSGGGISSGSLHGLGYGPDEVAVPYWQSGLNGANGASATYRNVPYVSADADLTNYFCFDYPDSAGSGSSPVNTLCSQQPYPHSQSTNPVGPTGGTSFAAPRWAGFLALVNEQVNILDLGPSVGFINPAIYTIGAGSNYGTDFNDILSGSNGTFSAGTGYDLVTGWGSPIGQNLINDLVVPPFGPEVPAPVITLQQNCAIQGNTYLPYNTVIMADSNAQATILYTTGTSMPNTSSTPYTVPIEMIGTTSVTYNAIAVYGSGASALVSQVVSFVAYTPTCPF